MFSLKLTFFAPAVGLFALLWSGELNFAFGGTSGGLTRNDEVLVGLGDGVAGASS